MNAVSDLTVEQIDEARNGLPARWTVKRDGRLIGLVERYRKSTTRTNAHRASVMTPSGLRHFDNFGGLMQAVEAITRKEVG
jgi:hypothetical protein